MIATLKRIKIYLKKCLQKFYIADLYIASSYLPCPSKNVTLKGFILLPSSHSISDISTDIVFFL